MMARCHILIAALWVVSGLSLRAQGFVNLGFEQANVSGYSQRSTDVPVGQALPGWTAMDFTSSATGTVSQVGYDAISTGSVGISVVDSNLTVYGLGPLTGKFSVWLFGANGQSVGISQTGLVPAGTQSLLMDVYSFYGFAVTVNGQTLNMVPVATNGVNDTVYGANVSGFAGQNVTLSLVAPPLANPNGVELDNIQFSSIPTPEPGVWALTGLGGGLLAWQARRRRVRGR